jgi:hypothetical protein
MFSVETVLNHFECFDPVHEEYLVIDRNQHVNVVKNSNNIFNKIRRYFRKLLF